MGDSKISGLFTPGEDHEQIINLFSSDPHPLLDSDDFTSVYHRRRIQRRRSRSFSPPRKTRAEEDDCYPVGVGIKLLLIFNFNIIVGEEERKGSYQDIANLRRTFERQKFEVKVYEDLTQEVVEKVLEGHRTSQNLKKTSALFMIFMSHGDGKDTDSFLSSDGKSINMEKDIRARFNDLNCPALAGKPKVMMGICCRNTKEGQDARTPPEHENEHASDGAVSGPEAQNIPVSYPTQKPLTIDGKAMPCISTLSDEKDYNDMMTIYSCAKGKKSYRDEMNGSLFVQALCKVINERGHKHDMYRIFMETQKEMRQKSPPDNTSLEGFEPCMEPPLTFGTLYLA